MSARLASRRFEELSADDRVRYRDWGREMVRLAQSFAVPIIFAPPKRLQGVINGASGSVVKVNDRYFVVTASHVLDGYEERVRSGEKLDWLIGRLPPIDPLRRIEWRDCFKDIVLLRLSEGEAQKVGSTIVSAPEGWPPPVPTEDQVVLVAGYPKTLREVVPSGIVGADYLAAMFRVTDVRGSTFDCRIGKDEDLVSFNGLPIPDEDMDMGGLSGAPAFIIAGRSINYLVLVGVVSKYISKSFDGFRLLRVAALKHASGTAALHQNRRMD
jgi:hypothetical protein